MSTTPRNSLTTIVLSHAARQPTRDALWCDDVSLDYGTLAARSCSLSRGLHELGVRRGDHLGVALPNCIELALLLLAAADLGAVLVPVSPALPAPAMQRAFSATDVRHVVAEAEVLRELRQSAPAYMNELGGICLALNSSADGIDLDTLSLAASAATPLGLGRMEDAYILTMTSGSTGDPKPIVFEQRTKLNRARATIELYGLTESERILAATPMYHSLAQRLTLMPLLLGAAAVLMPRFSVETWLGTLAAQKITFTIAVSSQLAQVARLGGRTALEGIDALRCIVSSSALLELTVKQKLCAMLRCKLHECYGTSETATATDLPLTKGSMSLASVGRPLPGVALRIVDAEGRDVPVGEEGEIVCRTPLMFAGYYKRPELTQQALLGDFFRTGDAGRLDTDGYLYFRGRLKEIIITGGINIYPKDIEEAVEALPDIAECAAFALPDAALGEIVALAMVPVAGASLDLRRVKMHCAEHLADFQQPRSFFVLAALPRNPMGKMVRRELAAQILADNGVAHT